MIAVRVRPALYELLKARAKEQESTVGTVARTILAKHFERTL